MTTRSRSLVPSSTRLTVPLRHTAFLVALLAAAPRVRAQGAAPVLQAHNRHDHRRTGFVGPALAFSFSQIGIGFHLRARRRSEQGGDDAGAERRFLAGMAGVGKRRRRARADGDRGVCARRRGRRGHGRRRPTTAIPPLFPPICRPASKRRASERGERESALRLMCCAHFGETGLEMTRMHSQGTILQC
jgi:hypothetical protein